MDEMKLLRYVRWFTRTCILILVLIIGFSSFYIVSEGEQAVVLMFGDVVKQSKAGPVFVVPIIQDVIKVSTKTRGMSIGYTTDPKGKDVSVEEECRMITGDVNIVTVDFYVEWNVSDPVKFLFASDKPEMILRDFIQSAARDVVGSHSVDDVMTSGRENIQIKIQEMVTAKLEKCDIGVNLRDVKIQDAEPPNEDVKKAFKDVESAKQGYDTAINNARAERNNKIADAKAKGDEIVKKAKGDYKSRLDEADGQVEKFGKMYAEYSRYPEITKTRMYMEALERINPNLEIYVDTTNDTGKLLPLKEFIKSN